MVVVFFCTFGIHQNITFLLTLHMYLPEIIVHRIIAAGPIFVSFTLLSLFVTSGAKFRFTKYHMNLTNTLQVFQNCLVHTYITRAVLDDQV